jgi:hypothetical protein
MTMPAQNRQVGEGRRPGTRGNARIPSPDGVLVAAIELVLTGAGLLEAAARQDWDDVGTGFLAVPVTGVATPRAAVIWYEDGNPTDGADAPAGKLRDCEQALLRAGFHVEYTAESTGGRLVAWRRRRTR